MTDTTGKSSLEQLLRPLRRALNAELATLLLRMQAEARAFLQHRTG
jgi:hypothetical protein